MHIRIAGDWTGEIFKVQCFSDRVTLSHRHLFILLVLSGGLAKLCSGDGKQTRSLADMPRLVTKIAMDKDYSVILICFDLDLHYCLTPLH